MTIEHDFVLKKSIVLCDECCAELEIEFNDDYRYDFDAILFDIKANGWRSIKKKGEEWINLCTECIRYK